MNFVKFLRTPFLQNTSGRLLLDLLQNKHRVSLPMMLKHEKSAAKNMVFPCILVLSETEQIHNVTKSWAQGC